MSIALPNNADTPFMRLAMLMLALAACGRVAPAEFCARAYDGVDIVRSKGAGCLVETTFRVDAFDTQGCPTRLEDECTSLDRARIDQWLSCWDELPSCSDHSRGAFVASGNACARNADLAAVAHRCRTVLGDTSTR